MIARQASARSARAARSATARQTLATAGCPLFRLPQGFVDGLVSAAVADLTPLPDATFVPCTGRSPERARSSRPLTARRRR